MLCRLGIVAALLPVFDLLPRVAQKFREGLRRIREAPAQLLASLFGLTAFAQAICALALQPQLLGFPLLDLITACFTVLSLQIAQGRGVVIQGALTSTHFAFSATGLHLQGFDMLLEEINAAGLPVPSSRTSGRRSQSHWRRRRKSRCASCAIF